MILRRWQAEAIPLALAALETGEAGIVVATTGAGKSIFIAELLRLWRITHAADEGVIVVSTPSRKLVEQLAATLGQVLGTHAVGRFYSAAKQHAREVVVCCNPSVPALAARYKEDGRPVALWLADEVHKTISMELRDEDDGDAEVGEALNAVRRMGVTATPFRSSKDERLALFDRVIYRYPPAEALRDGVIVPWRFVSWGDRKEEPVDAACVTLIRELGDRATRGPGVVNARSIDDAEAYCAFLAEHGLEALPIHSGMGKGQQEANITALREGRLDCLVHVSMLVEGVDMPWLRWGCFRREVGARVRFIQELGRYLRSDPANPAKVEAVILDPHDLAATFSVSYDEALGWTEPKEPGKDPEEYDEEAMAEKEDRPLREVMARRTDALSRYVRQLHLALIAEGICASPSTVAGRAWREDPASEKQAAALVKMVRAAARLGPVHREALGRLAETPAVLTKGLASDAFELLQGVRKLPGGKVWTPPVPVQVPPDVAFVPVRDPATYVAGVMKDGWAAVGIVRGGEVLYAKARPVRRGDRWVALATSAMWLAVQRHGATEVVSSEPDVVSAVPERVVGRLCKREENFAARVAWRELAREQKAALAAPSSPALFG